MVDETKEVVGEHGHSLFQSDDCILYIKNHGSAFFFCKDYLAESSIIIFFSVIFLISACYVVIFMLVPRI